MIADGLGGVEHALDGHVADRQPPVEHAVDGGDADARRLGEILDGRPGPQLRLLCTSGVASGPRAAMRVCYAMMSNDRN